MADFVTGRDLTEKIRYVVGGGEVKCAVAYWGSHGFDLDDVKNWKIVCDIVGGSTSPNALTALGAPTNSSLKHHSNLHSKVYLSDRGAVIGSANASAGGLHTMDRSSRMLEAGVYYDADDNIWHQATAWFDQLFQRADIVDVKALELAQARYSPPFDEIPENYEGMTILQQIVSNPAYFVSAGVGFVITRNVASADEISQAANESASAGDITKAVLKKWDAKRSFIEWSEKEMAKLSTQFIEFYIGPRGGKIVLTHQLAHRFDRVSDGDRGHFYTNDPKQKIKLPSGEEFPTRKDALSESDWKLILATQKTNSEGGIWGAMEFSQMLRSATGQIF